MAFSVGRVGSTLGPFAGAMLIRFGVDLSTLFALAAALLACGTIAAVVLAKLCARRMKTGFSEGVADVDSAEPAQAVSH